MEFLKVNSRFVLITSLILVAVLSRILPHPFNFTPVMAISLFAGAKFRDKKWSVIVPFSAMFMSDILLSLINHQALFHNTIIFIYGSILLIIALGWELNSEKSQPVKTGLFAVISSILFFIISNLGVWILGGLYTFDLAGLTKCFTMAVPYFQNTLLGDAFFTAALFGTYEFVNRKYPHLLHKYTLQPIDHLVK